MAKRRRRGESHLSGPVGAGTTYHYVAQIVGQKIDSSGEITAWEPPKKYAWKATSGPFPMSGGILFEAAEGGTRVNFWHEGEPGGFFKLAEPLLMKQVQSQVEKSMAKLKELLEK